MINKIFPNRKKLGIDIKLQKPNQTKAIFGDSSLKRKENLVFQDHPLCLWNPSGYKCHDDGALRIEG